MDDVDRKLMILVGGNPRIHIRELARRLGISRQAAHRRLQLLMQTGVIRGATAAISVSYLDAIPVAVSGRSRAARVEDALDRLGESEFMRRVIVAGGNYLYVVGFLREISDLNGFVDFVKRAAEISDPIVGIYCLDDGLSPYYSVDGGGNQKKAFKELSPLDLRIIASLKDNARRPIADVAEIVGVSAKTVRRHLEDMISDQSLEMSTPVDLSLGGDFFLVVHVTIRNGASKLEMGKKLLSKYPFQDAYIRTFSNLTNLLTWVFWSDNIKEIREAVKSVGEDADVEAVMLNFAYLERFYPNWRDKMLTANVRQPRKDKTRTRRSRQES